MNFGTLNRATIPDMSAQIQYPGRVSRVNPSGQALLFRHGNRFDAAFQRAAWKPLRADGKRNVRKDVKLELEFEVARTLGTALSTIFEQIIFIQNIMV